MEGPPDRPLLRDVNDASLVVESCFAGGVDAALLYGPNLTERFFDLSSGETGAILQSLRNYWIRLAVLCAPGSVRLSRQFRELLAEESGATWFTVCESREDALEWFKD